MHWSWSSGQRRFHKLFRRMPLLVRYTTQDKDPHTLLLCLTWKREAPATGNVQMKLLREVQAKPVGPGAFPDVFAVLP